MDDKVRVEPKLIRHNEVVNPMRELWRRGSEMEMKSRFVQLCWMRAHRAWWLFSDLNVRVKGEIVRICDWNTS